MTIRVCHNHKIVLEKQLEKCIIIKLIQNILERGQKVPTMYFFCCVNNFFSPKIGLRKYIIDVLKNIHYPHKLFFI